MTQNFEPGPSVLVWHWGNESAGAKFTYELIAALCAVLSSPLVVSSAHGNELSKRNAVLHRIIREDVSTFVGEKSSWKGKFSAALGMLQLPYLTRRFRRMLTQHDVRVAVCAFQSIWDVATLPVLSHGSTRSILVLHEAMFHPGDGYPLRERILRRQIENTDALIVLSGHVKHQVITMLGYPANRVWNMTHGVYRFGSSASQPAVHPRAARPVRLLFFGRIVAYKGIDRLLAAFSLLRGRGLPVELVIAGSGSMVPYMPLLRHVAAVTVQNEWLPESAVAKVLSQSDLVVLPYIEASQSGIAVSAYGAGRPVVAYPTGGLVEQIVHEQTGLIAHDMSVEALADALERMVREPDLLDACARGALKYANDHLGWRPCAELVAEVIDFVQAAPRRRANRG